MAENVLDVALIGFIMGRGGFGFVLLVAVAGLRLDPVSNGGSVEGSDKTLSAIRVGVYIRNFVERLRGNLKGGISEGFSWIHMQW